MANVSLLFDTLSNCKNALIIGHTHPDGDCVGSAIGLSFLLDAIGVKNFVTFPDRVPERLEFLLGEKVKAISFKII